MADLEFHSKSTWTLIRGNRYQVLEGEFFRYVLAPHDDALRQAYGVGAVDVAAGIQAIADALRMGVSNAVEGLQASMERVQAAIDETGDDMGAVLEQMSAEDPDFPHQHVGPDQGHAFRRHLQLEPAQPPSAQPARRSRLDAGRE